jgi:RNA polymerase sigma-70 factor (ECF subfamily)
MASASRSDVTALLRAWTAGDEAAKEKLWTIVVPELGRLAHRYMRQERPNHTLQTSAVVNEAYLRLVDWKKAEWRNRAHFFGMCARIMRQILVDHARAQRYQKRGGDHHLGTLDEAATVSSSRSEQFIALDDALQRLAVISKRKSDVVELRFFRRSFGRGNSGGAGRVSTDGDPGLEFCTRLAARGDERHETRVTP